MPCSSPLIEPDILRTISNMDPLLCPLFPCREPPRLPSPEPCFPRESSRLPDSDEGFESAAALRAPLRLLELEDGFLSPFLSRFTFSCSDTGVATSSLSLSCSFLFCLSCRAASFFTSIFTALLTSFRISCCVGGLPTASSSFFLATSPRVGARPRSTLSSSVTTLVVVASCFSFFVTLLGGGAMPATFASDFAAFFASFLISFSVG
mmetsp:Transcript_10400/g.24514  ORF Transcript_10400/g.24514 Transcript_10400/m.24514 type:complete len:207 (+) Transcript_10400:794-1414(+)